MVVVDDLVRWLRAQLDEDERVARDASDGPWRVKEGEYGAAVYGPDVSLPGIKPGPWEVIPPDVDYGEVVAVGDAEHIARHDPARVLAEVKVKRLLLAGHEAEVHRCAFGDYAVGDECRVQRVIALAYAGRSGYDPEWAPRD